MILYDSAGIEIKKSSSTINSSGAAANTALTTTLAAPAAGQYHYITALHISRQATAALAGSAILSVTTTNLPGSLGWAAGNGMAAGETKDLVQMNFDPPIKSSVSATATTIVMPAPGLAVQWRSNVHYFTGL